MCLRWMVIGGRGHDVLPRFEVKPYVLLDLFLMIWVLQELIYHEIGEAKP